MRGRAAWSLLSVGAVLLASSVARAQCTKDTDCKGSRVCDAGKCTTPTQPAPGAPAATPGAPAAAPAATPAAAPTTQPPAGYHFELRPIPTPSSELPPPATTPLAADEPQTHRRSRTALITGVLMASVGPIALLGALSAKNSQQTCDDNITRAYPDHHLPTSERYRVDECNAYSLPFYILSIGGGLLTAAAIPLIIYGAKQLPNHPPAASLRVVPWASPEAGGLKLRLEL